MHADRIQPIIPYSSGGHPRTPGVHVSGLLRKMAGEYGILKPEYVEDLSLEEVPEESERWWANLDQVAQIRMGMGLAWEQWYLPQLGTVVHQPGEMCVQGIYMTHDGESLDTLVSERGIGMRHVLCCHEAKLTYKSVNTVYGRLDPNTAPEAIFELKQNWLWITQTKSYLKGLSEKVGHLVNTVYLHVLFVCGDYSYPIRPQLHIWRLTFEPQEIEQAWSLIVDSLRRYRAQ